MIDKDELFAILKRRKKSELLEISAYIASLANTAKPEEFAAKALAVVRRDSGHSFCGGAYTSARKAANKLQLGELDAEIRARKVRTP